MANKYTEAQKRATLKYQEDKVKIQILVTPEQREQYKAHAESKGTNLTQLIIELLNNDVKNTRVKKFENGVKEAFKNVSSIKITDKEDAN